MQPAARQKARTTQNTPTRNGTKATIGHANASTSQQAQLDSGSVVDKIVQWQSSVDSEPRENANAKPAEVEKAVELGLRSKREDRDIADGVATPSDSNHVTADVRAATTPRKRIVSDENWLNARPSAQDPPGKEDGTPTKPRKNSANRRTSSGRADAWVRRKSNPSKVQGPAERLAEDTNLPSRPVDGPVKDLASCGTQIGSSNRAKGLLLAETLKSGEGEVEGKRPASADRLLEDLHERPSSFVRSAEENEGDADQPERLVPVRKTRKNRDKDAMNGRRAKSAGDKMHSSPNAAQEGIQNPFENRIGSWLNGTPDPFVEDSDVLAANIAAPPSDSDRESITRERKRRSRRRSRKHIDESRGVHEPMDAIEPSPDVDRDESPSKYRSTLQVDRPGITEREKAGQDDESSDNGSGKLKRSGARRKTSYTRAAPASPFDGEATKERELAQRASSAPKPTGKVEHVHGKEEVLHLRERRRFPTTGNRLSTIASIGSQVLSRRNSRDGSDAKPTTVIMDDKSKLPPIVEKSQDAAGRKKKERPAYKRKLTSHDDLISVLSMPRNERPQKLPVRSSQTVRTRFDSSSSEDLMNELQTDESKYLRELKTLVDGVIPVLLSCVLSQSQSAIAAGLFQNRDESDATSIIVSMGVALERLKSTHSRLPTQSPDAFVLWAQGAYRIYEDYLKVWRMGFQDVVVNLAPSGDKTMDDMHKSEKNDILDKDEDGYVVNSEGKKVDVAYLLKRPLVRLKYLAKTLKGINHLNPSEQNEKWVGKYEELVKKARHRQDEERARLEDVAAANIDATRAREVESLAPLAGVKIEPAKCVRARDYFDMKLQHSSGQLYDCRIELLLRESPSSKDPADGDILLCEVGTASRWLLFPPLQLSRLSVRQGNTRCEIVIMIRGWHEDGQEWHELLTLSSHMQHICNEWVGFLGLSPIPPKTQQINDFDSTYDKPDNSQALILATPSDIYSADPREVEVPIGEQASQLSKRWDENSPTKTVDEYFSDRIRQRPVPIPDLKTSQSASRHRSLPLPGSTRFASSTHLNDTKSPLDFKEDRKVKNEVQTGQKTTSQPHVSVPKGSRIQDPSHRASWSVDSTRLDVSPERKPVPVYSTGVSAGRQAHRTGGVYDSRISPGRDSNAAGRDGRFNEESLPRDYPRDYMPLSSDKLSPGRPPLHRRKSPNPSESLPTIPRTRAGDSRQSDHYKRPAGPRAPSFSPNGRLSGSLDRVENLNSSKPTGAGNVDVTPPATPSHSPRQTSTPHLRGTSTPQLPASSQGYKSNRRSSSPLKHEYAPSSASASSGQSDVLSDDDGASISSESSADEYAVDPALPLSQLHIHSGVKPSAPRNSSATPASVSPSQSASQGGQHLGTDKVEQVNKTIASIFRWSEKGKWESLHPNECSIVVSSGLIEAFELTAAHSKPDSTSGSHTTKPRPLIAQELTPLVPLRRGTAIDITIRSPPTENSELRQGNNIMYRSRNSQECEILYGMINHARIYNPTYIALQNERGPQGSGWGAYMDQKASQRGSRSWWRLGSKKSSYRAGSTRRTPSTAHQTESSVATMSSAISALKRFSSGSRMFNLGKSTISSRGHLSRSSGSFSSGSGSRPTSPVGIDPSQGTPAGIANAKIRLYSRESATKWKDLGSARLTIMHLPGAATPLPSGHLRQEKRVVVTGRTYGEKLLDVTLGETSFERVARTGIAVSVWEQLKDPKGNVVQIVDKGGVIPATIKVYMLQMKSEAETAYTFSLVGRLRY